MAMPGARPTDGGASEVSRRRGHKVWLAACLAFAQAFAAYALVPGMTRRPGPVLPTSARVKPAAFFDDAGVTAFTPAHNHGPKRPDRCRAFFATFKAILRPAPGVGLASGVAHAQGFPTGPLPQPTPRGDAGTLPPPIPFASLTTGLCRARC